MAIRDKRFTFAISEEELADLRALALANTGGNDSEMLRLLVDLAVKNPAGLGLNKPLYLEGKVHAPVARAA